MLHGGQSVAWRGGEGDLIILLVSWFVVSRMLVAMLPSVASREHARAMVQRKPVVR
jgi:hypothetical protein